MFLLICIRQGTPQVGSATKKKQNKKLQTQKFDVVQQAQFEIYDYEP
jgi:hypothetical protein